MNNDLESLYAEYLALISSFRFDKSLLDQDVVGRHIVFAGMLDVIENSAISIFDLSLKDHVYLSTKLGTLLGYDLEEARKTGPTYFDRFYHPDDQVDLLRAAIYFIRMGKTVPPETLKEYKMISGYRMKKGDGQLIRVIEQQVVIEVDPLGNPWLALSLLDVSPDRDIQSPFRCRLVNTRTGELFHFPPEEDTPCLSKREKQILTLISGGLVSRQIADRLFISVNTVNTHRQRILEKLRVSNTAEAILYASQIGLLA
jgi:DNA-binding CsgD family transcriptional regulator/PAS domain-containing protein